MSESARNKHFIEALRMVLDLPVQEPDETLRSYPDPDENRRNQPYSPEDT